MTHYLPSYAGPLMAQEINALVTALENPKRPVAAIVGGSKVSTKIPVLVNLAAKVDYLIIGGGMANTFLQAQGINVGKSLSEPDFHAKAHEIVKAAADKGCKIVLPSDGVVAKEFKANAAHEVLPVDKTPVDGMILDTGPKSVEAIVKFSATVRPSCGMARSERSRRHHSERARSPSRARLRS